MSNEKKQNKMQMVNLYGSDGKGLGPNILSSDRKGDLSDRHF